MGRRHREQDPEFRGRPLKGLRISLLGGFQLEDKGRWIVRRLAADCSRVELGELAGLHRASPYALATVPTHLADLTERAGDWLRDATEAMAQATRADFEAYRSSSRA